MSVQAKFVADLTQFEAAVQQSVVKLRDWRTNVGAVDKDLSRLGSSFSGQQVLREATLAAKAVGDIGGAAKLTASEQQRVNSIVTEAIAKYAALGQEAPKNLTDLAEATKQLEPPMTAAQKATGLLQSSFSQFTAANLAASAIQGVITKVGEFVETGTKLPAVEGSFRRLSSAVHEDSGTMLSSMDKAAKGMVSNYDLMLGANKAMLLGLPVTATSMGDLTKAAVSLGRAMGQDATKSVDDLITALGRSSPMILDNLGLSVKVAEANEAYAKTLNKSADALTDSEKKMAFYNAAMEAARIKTAQLGDQSKTLGEVVQTAWTQVGNTISGVTAEINVGMGRALTSMKGLADFLGDVMDTGIGSAVAMSKVRAEADRLAASAADINLPMEKTVDVLGKYREHLESLTGAVQKLTPEQERLIIQADALHENTTDIAKAMGIAEAAVAVTVDTHTKAAAAAKKHAEEIVKLNNSIYELGSIEEAMTKIADDARKQGRDDVTANAKAAEELNKQQLIHAAFIIDQLQRTSNAQIAASKLQRDNDFATAEYGIAQARREHASKQELARMEKELSLSRLNASIADRQAEFLAATAFMDQTTDVGKAEYAALADLQHHATERMKADWQASQAAMQEATHGFFGGIQRGFMSLVDGMTGKNGVAGFMENMGKGIVDGFGKILSGGLASVIEMGVNLAVAGIAKIGKLIAGLFDSEETKKVNKPRDAFFGQFGGYDGLASQLTDALAALGDSDAGNTASRLIRTLYDADTESSFKSAEREIAAVFKNNGRDIQLFREGTHGKYMDFGSGSPAILHGRERVMTEAEGLKESAMEVRLASIELLLDAGNRGMPRALYLAMKQARALA